MLTVTGAVAAVETDEAWAEAAAPTRFAGEAVWEESTEVAFTLWAATRVGILTVGR